jgi:NAD(P)-dependent dehydrogenase (short-subunit alcohol dehydrogenase family)
MGRLDGKVAIITGAAGGIGKETARTFLEEGAKVALVDLAEEELNDLEDDLKEFGELITVTADVSDEDDVKNYVQETKNAFGQIDVFFNNAGVTGDRTPLVDIELEDFANVMNINVNGVFLGLKHVLPVMMEQENGSIINTSSVDGLRGSPELAPYSTSKHAVVGLTKTAALEAAEKGVRVNSIHPSPVDTDMMRGLEDSNKDQEEAQAEFAEDIPIGRYAKPVELANLLLFLAADDSEFITGSQYRIDGGMGAQQ